MASIPFFDLKQPFPKARLATLWHAGSPIFNLHNIIMCTCLVQGLPVRSRAVCTGTDPVVVSHYFL
jgi:hypothetical protein